MEIGEALLGYDVFNKLCEMLVCQDITLDEWDEACCDLDYANELIRLHYMVPSY